MKEYIEKIYEMAKDLEKIFEEEFEERRVITGRFTAIKMLEKGYRKQEWISVEDRLPKQFETVLVFCDGGTNKFYCVSEMIESNGKRWSAVCGFRVTHWMPLPEPPKMKGGAK